MRLALAVCLLSSLARGDEWQWRADGGGEVNASSHGVVDLGVRRGPWSVELRTDTLDLRFAPEDATGRAWLAARGELFAAGLLLSPWTDGKPDPTRALLASYGGVEAGWVRYLPHSIYGGVSASGRLYTFSARDVTRIPVPGLTSLITVDLFFGRWTPTLRLSARAGADAQNAAVQPHLAVEAIFAPEGALAPRLELRAGVAYRQTDLTRTRLGGLNPYVVPLAGAGWAEFWVDNYAAARLALTWSTKYTAVAAALDAAAFDGAIATGFALLLRGHYRRWFAEADVGYAPYINRQPGVGRVSAWFLVGSEWGRFR